jgi:hypothetical protein
MCIPGAFPRVKHLGHAAEHSPLSSDKVKKEWSCTFTASCAFVACVGTALLSFYRDLLACEDVETYQEGILLMADVTLLQ